MHLPCLVYILLIILGQGLLNRIVLNCMAIVCVCLLTDIHFINTTFTFHIIFIEHSLFFCQNVVIVVAFCCLHVYHHKLVTARLKFKRGEEDCRERAQEA